MVTRWKFRGLCAGRTDLDWFADVPSDACLALCAKCPVAHDCLGEALMRDRDIDSGCWGGTAAGERTAIREGTSWQRSLL
jgi:hypothetical protein